MQNGTYSVVMQLGKDVCDGRARLRRSHLQVHVGTHVFAGDCRYGGGVFSARLTCLSYQTPTTFTLGGFDRGVGFEAIGVGPDGEMMQLEGRHQPGA